MKLYLLEGPLEVDVHMIKQWMTVDFFMFSYVCNIK